MTNTLKILISGASTGIGRASAEALAQAGHHVYAGVRKADITFDHPNVRPLILEVTEPASVQRALAEIKSQANGLDILMNNAGIAVGGPLEAIGFAAMKKQMDVNVLGLYELSRQALPLLRESKSAKIINVSSVSGLFASPFMGAYSASKFAVEAMSDSWRRELRKFGIKVVLLEPGPIATPIWEKSLLSQPKLEHEEFLELYQPELNRFQEYVTKEAHGAMPVEELVKVVAEIVATRRPRARYVVNGRKTMLKAFAMLPESWVDSLIMSAMGRRR